VSDDDSARAVTNAPVSGLVVFFGQAVPEDASPLVFDRPAAVRAQPRWHTASQYGRILVRGEANQQLSLRSYRYAPGVIVPRHSYTTDEIYFVLAGELIVAGQRLGAGDGFSVAADTAYQWVSGAQGVEVLKIRAQEHYVANFDV
jgi:hypothetical protein